jgi:hypothetical protein
MTEQKQAMEQALEALLHSRALHIDGKAPGWAGQLRQDAMGALRAALSSLPDVQTDAQDAARYRWLRAADNGALRNNLWNR